MAHYRLFVFSGQSNMSAYSPMGTLRGSGLVSNPGSPGSAPDYVPGYQQTALNEWTGSPPASVDTGIVYDYPTDANAPCLYNESVDLGSAGVYNYWGTHDKQRPTNSSGTLADAGSYGLELSFLARARAAYPAWNLAAIKCSMGGSQLAEWLPANTGSNATGSDTAQFAALKLMIQQAGARLAAADHTWEAAFLWMQGESGAHTWQGFSSDATYLSDARLFFAAVRSLFTANGATNGATAPVLVGRIGDNWLNTNPYLTAAGVPWASIDYSITSALGTVNTTTRNNALAGANARRATQVTLGSDPNCAWWDNDGYPTRPPYSLTAANTDTTGYHWGHPGNLAAGERAFAAYGRLIGRGPKRIRLGNLKLYTN